MDREPLSTKILIMALIGVLIFAFSVTRVKAPPTTWTVDDDKPADFSSIQEALDAASSGDTLYVYNGTYYEHLYITKDNLTIVGENANGTIIDGGGDPVAVVDVYSNNVKISGFTIQNGFDGIYLLESNGTILRENTLRYNNYGITLDSSNSNIIADNTIVLNTNFGIDLYSSAGNTVSGNIISDDDSGIGLSEGSTGNIIFGNTISYNGYVGFDVWASVDNVIYHNNLIQNTQQVYSSGANVWDNGVEGNYWSNYAGVDISGGGDGIGDDPHFIDQFNNDSFPLMGPISFFFSGTWNNKDYYVHTISNSSVSDFYFNPAEGAFVRFDVAGDGGTVGFCRAAIPKDLLWTEDGWTVLVDGQPATPTITIDENYTYLYFTYGHSKKTVQIIGTNAVPEFPSMLMLPLFMISTLLAVIVYRKRTGAR